MQRGLGGDRLRAAADSGTRATSISAATPEARAELAEIAGKPVGDIHRRAAHAWRNASASALRGCGTR